jgi:hypothetical protein
MSIYNNDYVFKLERSVKEEDASGISRKLTISAHSRQLHNSNFYFLIKCKHRQQDTFIIESIAIVDDYRFSQAEQRKIYLMGAFDLKSTYSVDQAINELKEELNGAEPDERTYSHRWSIFSSQLKDWYNKKIRAVFEKDIEVTRLYFSDSE